MVYKILAGHVMILTFLAFNGHFFFIQSKGKAFPANEG